MLRQAVSGLTNVQAVYYADQVNGEAQRQATFRSRLSAMAAVRLVRIAASDAPASAILVSKMV